MELLEAIKARHSTREFLKDKIPFNILEELVEAARLAPSACNLQLTEYIVLEDEKIISELREKVSDKFDWAPNFIVVIYDSRFTVHRHANIQSAGMGVENILLMAVEKGVSACPMAGFKNDAALKEILGIPEIYKIALIVALGYPRDREVKDGQRLPLLRIMHKNRYSALAKPLKATTLISRYDVRDIINYRERLAPVYLYKNHYRLGNFSLETNREIIEVFKNIKLEGKILDLFSYDGDFLRGLADISQSKNWQIFASDYLDYTLNIIRKTLPHVTCVAIGEDNKIQFADSSLDAVLAVNKLQFTPELGKLVAEVNRILKPGGRVYIIDFKMPWFKSLLRLYYGKKLNVYENNSFYKIGPFGSLGRRKMAVIFGKYGFKKNQMRQIFRDNSYKFYLSIFEKSKVCL